MAISNFTLFQLVDSRGPGGIETHILNLSKWLLDNGFNNQVIFLKDHGSNSFKDLLTANQISWRCLANLTQLGHELTSSPHILCTHGYKAGIVGRALGWWTGTPTISTFHSGDRGQGKMRIYNWIDELSASMASKVISVSNEICQRLPVPSKQIDNFITQRQILAQRGKTIAFVGRISTEKGPFSFARIVQNLDIPCHVYGDGPLLAELKSQYPQLKYFGHVHMDQHWEDIGLLCITSVFEGLPLVALEAMIRGVPVVSYAVGGLPDLISTSHNGWLIPPGDEVTFRRTIELWSLKSSVAKAQMAVAAHNHISKNYTDEMVCPKIIEVYRTAILERKTIALMGAKREN